MESAELKEKIKSLSQEYLHEVISIRRHIHSYPELGFNEYKTAEFIISKLKEYGIPYQSSIAKTGIVGFVEGKNNKGKTIALRADMDALPIIEENEVEYKSKNEGLMHACGHDVHIACLLGAAKILNELKDELNGGVKLIFQPSEETFPGGAKGMIKEGVLLNPKVRNVIGQHVYPELDPGTIGLKPGSYMASTDEVYITVIGKGGHAATPSLVVNPINIAAEIILELEKEFNKNKPTDSPSLLVFGRITGEGRTNVVPDIVEINGTLRTFDETWRNEVYKLFVVAMDIAIKKGGSCSITIKEGYPVLVNDDGLTKKVKQYACEYLGEENVVDLEKRMTAEDFAYFNKKVPSCFYRLGTRNKENRKITNLHTSTFNVDEKSMLTGMGLMAWIAFSRLK